MFEEFRTYPKEKVKLYMRYLVNAAKNQKFLDSYFRMPEPFYSNINLAERLSSIDDDRREELETKIKAFYTKNRYMPLLVRLKKIKDRYLELKKTGKDKRKLFFLKTKIEKCHQVIKRMEKLDQMRESLKKPRHVNLL